MAWGKVGSKTVATQTNEYTVDDITASDFNFCIASTNVSANQGNSHFRFNGSTGTTNEYAFRTFRDFEYLGDGTTQALIPFAGWSDGTKRYFTFSWIYNKSDKEKLTIGADMSQNTAGSGATANVPHQSHMAGKWVKGTPEAITKITFNDSSSGEISADTTFNMLGSDVTPAPSTPAVPAIPALMPVVGGWKEVARHTLTTETNPILASSIPDKKYYMILWHTKHTSGSWNQPRIRFGNGTTDAGGNYAQRYQMDYGQVTNALNTNTYMLGWAGQGNEPNQPLFGMGYIVNKSGKEKLAITYATDNDATGNTDAPRQSQQVAKWINNNILDRIELNNFGNMAIGDELVVLGWDPDDTHTDNFWEELADVTTGSAGALSSGTFTAKKYLWVQAYTPSSSNGSPDGYIEFNGDSATNYCHRRSHNGGSQTVGTQDGIGIRIDGTGGTTAKFHNFFIKNVAGDEKLVIATSTTQQAIGATNAPSRTDSVGKWVNTSDQITRIDIIDQYASPNWGSGSFIKVWGHD